MEENDKEFMTILKWAGVVALVAVPLVLFLKKLKAQEIDETTEDDANIFAGELES
ncbi:MAG: hypothetical protein HY707_09375 [Ignavibacteriae bacterium]|nr:hypothetical protein [Ignavibacteriota bacterium]